MPAPRKQGKRVLQWVFSGISDVSPLQQTVKNSITPVVGFSNRDQRIAQGLPTGTRKGGTRKGGQDSSNVLLPPRQRAPPPRRLRLSRLNLLPPPHMLDAAGLGRAAGIAAREATGASPVFWANLGDRARELLPSLDPQDLALLLNGMTRARHCDQELIEALRQRALARLAYFTARHITMVVSAFAKVQTPIADIDPFLAELRERIPELHGAGELAMAVTALGRLQAADDKLLRGLAAQIEARLSADEFHARELASVMAAYVRFQFLDQPHLSILARCARNTLHEAAPLELAQLVHAIASSRASGSGEFIGAAARLAAEKVPFMLPHELVRTVFAFGFALEAGLAVAAIAPMLPGVVQEAARAAVRLEARQLSSVLHSCARWHIPVPPSDLASMAGALGSQCDVLEPVVAGQALHALMALKWGMGRDSREFSGMLVAPAAALEKQAKEDGARAAIQSAATALDALVRRALARDDVCIGVDEVHRVVEASFMFSLSGGEATSTSNKKHRDLLDSMSDSAPLSLALSARLSRPPSFGAEAANTLHQKLLALGGDHADPVLQVLKEHAETSSA